MPDRGKVMQWLETCANGCEDGCPYEYKNLVYRVECKADLMSDALELLKEQPEIVRCKDCKHSCDYTDIYPYRIAYKCIKNGGYHNDDWFCADGERR